MAGLPFTCSPTATHSRFDAQPFQPSTRFQWPSPRSLCRWLGFWVAEVSQSRARRHVSAEKLEPESRSTSTFKIWTWLERALSTTAVWRLWRMACLCSTGLSWQVSVLRRDGTPHPRCATTDGAEDNSAGRWSEECHSFLRQSAEVRRGSTPQPVPDRTGVALEVWDDVGMQCASRRPCRCSNDGEVKVPTASLLHV